MDVGRGVKSNPGMPMFVVVPLHKICQEDASICQAAEALRERRSVLQGLKPGFAVGLSLETFGRECDLVTSRSDSNAATVLEVIDVPRSAWTTCGTPWIPKISFIISTANGPDSWAWTTAPTM